MPQPVKLNAAAILREGALVHKSRKEDEKRFGSLLPFLVVVKLVQFLAVRLVGDVISSVGLDACLYHCSDWLILLLATKMTVSSKGGETR